MTEGEKGLIRNIQCHDLAESYRLRRAKMAQEAGLSLEHFDRGYPFPGNVTIMTVPTLAPAPQTNGNGNSWLKTVLVTLGAIALLGGGLLGGYFLSQRTPVAMSPPSIQSPPKVDNVELEIRWKKLDDGTWEMVPPYRTKE